MSDYFILLIPEQPVYIPSSETQERVRALLESLDLRDSRLIANKINLETYEHIEFVSAGQNFGYISCPICKQRLEETWWQETVTEAYKTEFLDLMDKVPCCGALVSLNDLDYELTVGFARFVIKMQNPLRELTKEEIYSVEDLIGCKIKYIQAHY